MQDLLPNIIEVFKALLGLIVLSTPVGLLTMRVIGIRGSLRGLMLPVNTLFGLLIVPLYFNLIAVVTGLTLHMQARLLLWGILILVLYAVERRIQPAAATDQQHDRPHVLWTLLAISIISGVMTAAPLIRHHTRLSDRAYMQLSMFDWHKHVSVAVSLALDDELPPANPFISSEPQLRYYYYAYILPAMTANTVNSSVVNSLTALAVLIALGFPVVLYQFARRIKLPPGAALVSTGMIMLVGGLDILYVLVGQVQNDPASHIDFWVSHSARRINAIGTMLFWVPQHVVGLVGFVFVLWLLHHLTQQQQTNKRRATIIMTAVMIAALNGTSAFVWFGLMAGLGVFTAFEIAAYVRRRDVGSRMLPSALVTIMLLSLVLSVPHILLNITRGAQLFALRISPTRPGIFYGGMFSQLFGASQLTFALDFPFQMIPEFGLVWFTGIAGWWSLRHQWWRSSQMRQWSLMALVFLIVVLAIREDRPESNNYAARVAPMLWIMLGLWTGHWWAQRRHQSFMREYATGIVIFTLVFIGLASSVFEPYKRWRQRVIPITEIDLFEWINHETPKDARFQVFDQMFSERMLFSVERRFALSQTLEDELFISDLDLLEQARSDFTFVQNAADPMQAAQRLQASGADYIILLDHSPMRAQDATNFTTYFTLVFENEIVRVYRVGDGL